MTPGPVTVAVVNDFEIVVRGVRAMLAPYEHRVKVVETRTHQAPTERVDVRLYDTFSEPQVEGEDLESVLADRDSGAVIVYTWNLDPRLVETALAMGYRGYLVKGIPAQDLVEAVERVAAGEVVTSEGLGDEPHADPPGAWPGQSQGLSAREAEIVSLISRGMTNQDIATRTYLSINSIKTYIRTAYRKMGVTRRAQAVRWGMEHGLAKEDPSGSEGTPLPTRREAMSQHPAGTGVGARARAGAAGSLGEPPGA